MCMRELKNQKTEKYKDYVFTNFLNEGRPNLSILKAPWTWVARSFARLYTILAAWLACHRQWEIWTKLCIKPHNSSNSANITNNVV